MEERRGKKKVHVRILQGRMLEILLIILILLSVAIPLGSFYFQKYQARTVLRHGKDLFLAANVANTECYATNSVFLNAGTKSGVSPEAEANIYLTSKTKGSFKIVQWKSAYDKTCELYYWEDSYMAHLLYEGSSNTQWNVYKINQVAGLK